MNTPIGRKVVRFQFQDAFAILTHPQEYVIKGIPETARLVHFWEDFPNNSLCAIVEDESFGPTIPGSQYQWLEITVTKIPRSLLGWAAENEAELAKIVETVSAISHLSVNTSR